MLAFCVIATRTLHGLPSNEEARAAGFGDPSLPAKILAGVVSFDVRQCDLKHRRHEFHHGSYQIDYVNFRPNRGIKFGRTSPG